MLEPVLIAKALLDPLLLQETALPKELVLPRLLNVRVLVLVLNVH